MGMDFGVLPPEINSGRMYSGAGSGPMLAAALAWNSLAAELRSTAAAYLSVVSGLTSGHWHGPASTSMAAAATPYVGWMNSVAAQAEQTAAHVKAAVGAYEGAFAATVPPPVIAANRALLASLVATNILGQNTPAIAVTEAHYGAMWAQDAAAMYGYAGSSSAATELTPFTTPMQNTNPAGPAAQAAALAQATGTSAGASTQATLSQLSSAVPSALQSLAVPAASASSSPRLSGILGLLMNGHSGDAGLDDFWTQWGPNANIWNTIFSSGFYMPSNTIGAFTSFFSGSGTADSASGAAAGAAASEVPTVAGLSGAGSTGSAPSARLGQAASLGPLSVPPGWTAAEPPTSPLSSTLVANELTGPPAGTPGMPGMPMPSAARNGMALTPKYGSRPTVMARPPAAG